jgi:predicted oxidoreductase
MDEDGDMLRRNGLVDFAKTHQLKMISIEQLLEHRKAVALDLDKLDWFAIWTESMGNKVP